MSKNDLTIDHFYSSYIDKIDKQEKKITENITKYEKNGDSTKLHEEKTKMMKIKKKKQEYFLNNSNELFNYFESKQKIEENKNPKKMILNFFNQEEKNKKDESTLNNLNNSIKTYIKKNNFSNTNLHEYTYDNDLCDRCNKGEMIKVVQDGIMLCNVCFASKVYFVDNDKPSYKEPPKEISFYAYKRINHFREILSQFQAKESTDIPNDIIDKIKNQIKKERIQLSELTNKKTKEVLKKLGFNKYYEHIPFIKDRLGIKPPIMSPILEETLCNLFMDIQIPYSKYCPNDRVNFLNYYYTLYKLCELLGEYSYLPHFPMLKDQKKTEQDEIWKKICYELKWEFIPTL
jgi:CII-binding regulator of phage lambda lysogenization HflD